MNIQIIKLMEMCSPPAYEDKGDDLPPGTHEYTLEDDGTIHSDGHIYYRYEKETYSTDESSVDQSEDEETHYKRFRKLEKDKRMPERRGWHIARNVDLQAFNTIPWEYHIKTLNIMSFVMRW